MHVHFLERAKVAETIWDLETVEAVEKAEPVKAGIRQDGSRSCYERVKIKMG